VAAAFAFPVRVFLDSVGNSRPVFGIGVLRGHSVSDWIMALMIFVATGQTMLLPSAPSVLYQFQVAILVSLYERRMSPFSVTLVMLHAEAKDHSACDSAMLASDTLPMRLSMASNTQPLKIGRRVVGGISVLVVDVSAWRSANLAESGALQFSGLVSCGVI
jgi:hypothetical protein